MNMRTAYIRDAYDASISDEVRLSEVLDELLHTYEKPDIVIAFIKMHDADFDDIIAHSLNYQRIFMIDFIMRCSPESIDYIIKKLTMIPVDVALQCCWQILSSHADIGAHIKTLFRQKCSILQTGSAFKHPYSHLCTPEVKDVDIKLFEVISNGGQASDIALCINSLDLKMWENFTNDMHKSLFQRQIVQANVVEMLDEDHIRVLLLSVNTHMNIITYDHVIMMQWLNADLSVMHKEFICKMICATSITPAYSNGIKYKTYEFL